jgi:hypothetical protein
MFYNNGLVLLNSSSAQAKSKLGQKTLNFPVTLPKI